MTPMHAAVLRFGCWVVLYLPLATCWAQSRLLQQGEAVFKARCVVCHGVHADGKSKLAKMMTPPPANLRTSKLDVRERERIVTLGGAGVGRSARMPTWKDELSSQELQAVIAYVGTLKSQDGSSPPSHEGHK